MSETPSSSVGSRLSASAFLGKIAGDLRVSACAVESVAKEIDSMRFLPAGRDLEPGERAQKGDVWLTEHGEWKEMPSDVIGLPVSANGSRVRRPIPFRYVPKGPVQGSPVIPNPEYSELKGVLEGVMGSNQPEPVNTCSPPTSGILASCEIIDEANTKQKNLHSDPDARRWAREFVENASEMLTRGHNPRQMLRDEEWLQGWFANAMMAMHDHLYRTEIARLKDQAIQREERLGRICEILQTGDAVLGVQIALKTSADLRNQLEHSQRKAHEWKDNYKWLEVQFLEVCKAHGEVQPALEDARAIHSHFQGMIADALDDAGVPQDHPILAGAEYAKPMTPQERIEWLKNHSEGHTQKLGAQLQRCQTSNDALSFRIEQKDKLIAELSQQISDFRKASA